MTQDLKIALKNADVIMIVTPASAHKNIAEEIAPFLTNNQIIVLNPGRTFGSVEVKRIIEKKGTDTARLRKAGAKKVIWLKATLKGLKEGLKRSFLELKDSKGLVIEGTSVLRYLKPDLAIYIDDGKTRLRPAAKEADIIISPPLKLTK